MKTWPKANMNAHRRPTFAPEYRQHKKRQWHRIPEKLFEILVYKVYVEGTFGFGE